MKRLELLDYGRFFAAIIVVSFHYTFNGIANGKISSISHIPSVIDVTKYGYLGVELFFMISGYVVFISAKNRSATEFAINRAIRLYPSYWFAILFTSFFAMLWGSDSMSVTLFQVILNFSMLQSFVGVGHVDGVYWTLVYEITFYIAIFFLLLCGLQKQLNSIFIYWPALFCMSFALGLQNTPYLGGYYYYFSAGAIFAILSYKFSWRAAFSLLTTYSLCMHYSTGKTHHLTESTGIEYSSVAIGLIVSLFFIIFLYQNSKTGLSLRLPMSRTVGALTYPIYLIHAHFGYMFLSEFATDDNIMTVYSLLITLVLVTSLTIHIVIEKHLHHVWKKLFNFVLGRPFSLAQKALSRIQMAYVDRSS